MLNGLAAQLQERAVEFRQTNDSIDIIQYEPNVVYSVIPWAADPETPVLYFSVYNDDYTPVTALEAVVDIIGAREDVRKFISHCEHPVTGLPCFFLHPCNTKAMLDSLGQDKYILWLAGVGRSVGLAL